MPEYNGTMSVRRGLTLFLCMICILITKCFGGENNQAQEFVFTIPQVCYHILVDDPHVMITTFSTEPVNATVSVPGLSLHYDVTITRTNGADIALPPNVRVTRGEEAENKNKTIIVRSQDKVSVYAIDNDQCCGDAFQVFPSSHLGNKYHVVSYPPSSGSTSSVSISALSTPTLVTIHTTSDQELVVYLDQYQSYRFDGEDDLSGAIICSNATIAAISGSNSETPLDGNGRGGIITQLIPVDMWGTKYHIFPFATLNAGFIYRTFSGNISTTLLYSNGSCVHIPPNSFYEGDAVGNAVVSFEADHPVMVAQYMKSAGQNSPTRGNPSMSIIPPVSSYTSNVTFPTIIYSYPTHVSYNINIVTKCENVEDMVLNDNVSLSTWGDRLTSNDQTMCCVRGEIWSDETIPSYHAVTHPNADATFFVSVYAICSNCRSSYFHTALGYYLASVPTTPAESTMQEIYTTEVTEQARTTENPRSTEQPQETIRQDLFTAENTERLDPQVTFQWDVTETEIYIQEDSKYLDLSVKITREGTTKEETVDIQVNSITATEGSDFKVPRYIEFDTDDDTKTVRIEIINDDAKEGVESFQLILYHDSSAGNIGDPSKITVYIQDNDGYAKEHTGFESQNTTFECDIKNSNASQEEWSNYTTVTLYMQNGNNLKIQDAIKLHAISASNTFIEFEYDDISFTFELISSNSDLLKANVTIYDLELHYSGYFWCVFRRPDDPYTSFLAYEQTLMSVSPCVEPTSALATSENKCIGLTELNMVNVSNENVAEVADALAQVTDRSDGDGIFTPTEIDQVGDVITSIVAVGDGSAEVTGSVVESISNLIGAVDTKVPPESQVSNNTTTRIANSLEQQVALSLKVNNDVKIVDSNVAVQASKPKPDTITGIGIAILSEPTTVFSNSTTETILENDNSHPPALIYLPRNTVRRIQDESNKEIGFIFLVYRNDFLFPSNKTNLVVDGPILAASVTEGGELRKQNTLSAPLEYETRGQQEEVTSNDTETQKHKIEARVSCYNPTPQCVFYNYSIREWSQEGCRYLGRHNETGNHQCECEHLTNFAVLVYPGKKPVVSEALDIISKLGCGLSITALTLTVILFTFFKKLRRKARTITVHLCLSLIGLYAVFLIAVDWVCPKVVCTITAALLHYFVLTSMAWMAVEARFLYIKLVRVFDPENAGFVTRCAVLAWGVPLVIVAISLGISFGTGSDAYQNNQYCFPKVGLVVYLAVLLPIAISLVHNIITFGIIMKSIFRQRPGQRSRRSRAEKKILIERVRHSITITCLLGLTWILGFLAIDSAALAFQWLFCIMNSFQGVFIFIFMCLLQDEVKTVLFSSCLVESRSSSQTGSGFSTGDKSTAGGHSSSDFRSVNPSSNDYDSGTISTNDGGYSNRGIEMNDQS